MVIALLTDFGTQDYYVAAMKGVILSIDTNANIVDITHEIPPQDIASASFVLKACYKDFPLGTIFVCVVDPGVGSDRRALVVETDSYKFVAPDNGLLDDVLSEGAKFKAFSITNREYMRSEVGNTFHGRDIFAPAGGHLSKGVPPSEFGEPMALYIEEIGKSSSGSPAEAKVIHIDHFGNIVTNIRNDELTDAAEIEIDGRLITKVYDFYAQAKAGELFMIRGSSGLVEISVRDGSANTKLETTLGARLNIKHKISL